MSDIPTNVFRQILRRVPAEPLFRFRSVCKSWRRIIDHPGFGNIHIDRGIGDDYLLLRNDTGKVYLLPFTSSDDFLCYSCCGEGCTECHTSNKVKLVDAINIKTPLGPHLTNLPAPSCNGLILISSFKKKCVWLIWNPFTGESVEIPPPPVRGETTYTGFGYGKAKNGWRDYKVMRVVEPETFIYSVNLGVWHKIKESRTWGTNIKEKVGAFVDGALHWVGYPVEGRWNLEFGYIVSLDLRSETYNVIDLPWDVNMACADHPVGDVSYSLDLVAVNGCLFLMFVNSGMEFSMWNVFDNKEIVSLYKSNVSLIAYFGHEDKALFHYKSEKFLWYEAENDCLQKVRMEVNPNADGEDDFEHLYDTFTCQVLPSNFARLKIHDDGPNEGAASKGTSSKKRKRNDSNERLGLKLTYAEPVDLS